MIVMSQLTLMEAACAMHMAQPITTAQTHTAILDTRTSCFPVACNIQSPFSHAYQSSLHTPLARFAERLFSGHLRTLVAHSIKCNVLGVAGAFNASRQLTRNIAI